MQLLRAFADGGGHRVVTAGSCLEYDWNFGYCSEDRTPCRPQTTYGVCKHALQLLTSEFAARTGLSSAWARVFFPYGPHEHPGRLVPSVIAKLRKGERIALTKGEQVRDTSHVNDVGDAIAMLAASAVTGAVNIASGTAASVREVVTILARLLGGEELLDWGAIAYRDVEAMRLVGDNKRITGEVGWAPRFTLVSGPTAKTANPCARSGRPAPTSWYSRPSPCPQRPCWRRTWASFSTTVAISMTRHYVSSANWAWMRWSSHRLVKS
jgi:nucleoside-diphosphate-sugar epimerase